MNKSKENEKNKKRKQKQKGYLWSDLNNKMKNK